MDSSPGISADTYSSVNDCIKTFAETYMSKRYLRANYTYYHGGFLGNKDSGINVSYASDPYWGEKIAALAWAMDNEGGRKDQNKYSIGITNANSLAIRKEANTSSTQLYNNGKLSNYAFLILGETGDFYKIQSDPVLDSGRTKIDMSTGVYNSSKMYAYTSKNMYLRSTALTMEQKKERQELSTVHMLRISAGRQKEQMEIQPEQPVRINRWKLSRYI